ncbi:MAG: DUF2958 domain-containing protein [Solirubrobacteraceae bacterium]
MQTNSRPIDYWQPDPRFREECHHYLRTSDELPSQDEIAELENPLCRVKLFVATSRYTYYVSAATWYEDVLVPGSSPRRFAPAIVLTGFCVSPLGLRFDEYGDSAMSEIAALRDILGLPVERDLHFTPARLTAVEAAVRKGRPP